jgi:hypothetical protein
MSILKASKLTVADLYRIIELQCKNFIDADKTHITILTADIVYTYYQDRLGLTHYLFFVGKPGSGKSNNLDLIYLLGYRNFKSTDMTPANIYQFLGNQEEAIGTLCIDEANSIDENNKLMEIFKTGYVRGGKVARTDIHNGRVQLSYYTFGYKAFAAEREPDSIKANGLKERILPQKCYDGNPKYDIAEIMSPAGEEEYQQLIDEIEAVRNLMLLYRITHYFEPIPNVNTNLKKRERQLFISLIRIFHEHENVFADVKSAIEKFISERRQRQSDTFEACLYHIVKTLIDEKKSLEIESSSIWDRVKELPGHLDQEKPLSYFSRDYGKLSQRDITKKLIETFGAEKSKSHGKSNKLIFNLKAFRRRGAIHEQRADVKIRILDGKSNGIDGDDGDDSKYGMDVFVEDNHSASTSDPEVLDGESNNSSEVKQDDDDSRIDGDDGDDGIDQREEDNDNKVTDLDSRSSTDISCPSSSVDHHNINSQIIETDHSLANTNNQIRKAITTTSAQTDTNNLSHLSHLSHPPQLTTEIIARFFYDDPELPYHPLPPHKLEESPCKSIIGIDNHSFYYCALDPDVRSIHLESIEHHIKYNSAETHKSEILRLLGSNFSLAQAN